MTNLRSRFRALDQLTAPELWHEAESRAAAAQARNVRVHPWVFAALVLLLALAIGAAALIGSSIFRLRTSVEATAMPSPSEIAATSLPTPFRASGPAWTATGSMIEPRSGYTATLLDTGKVLVAGGDTAAAELYDPTTGSWTGTGAMIQARPEAPTATLLPNGMVLMAGGYDRGGLASAEVYDPTSGTWTTTGRMNGVRFYHTATLLLDGTVLLAGGIGIGRLLSSAELYDPRTGSWTATGRMGEAREGHSATLLLDGSVLVVGGEGRGGSLASAELYDPRTGTWTVTGSLTEARLGYTPATLLPDGRVLVAGGDSAALVVEPDAGGPGPDALTLSAAELYDPESGSWTLTGSMREARRGHIAALLPDGTVLVAGGHRNDTSGTRLLASAELYDPSSGSWALTSGMLEARISHTAIPLPDGTVLVVGGAIGSDLVELYDPGSGS